MLLEVLYLSVIDFPIWVLYFSLSNNIVVLPLSGDNFA